MAWAHSTSKEISSDQPELVDGSRDDPRSFTTVNFGGAAQAKLRIEDT